MSKKTKKRSKENIQEERAVIGGYAHPRDPVIAALFGIGAVTDSGVIINENTIFNSSAVFAAVNILSSALGSLSCEVMEESRNKDGTTNIEIVNWSDRENKVLGFTPNSMMTAITYFATQEQHALLWGNAYSEIETTNGGDLLNLWPVNPDICEPIIRENTSELWYEVKIAGQANRYVPSDKMLHIPGLGFDGIRGYSVLDKAKHSVGLTIAAEKHGAKFYRNSSIPSGILKTEKNLKDTQISRMRKSWDDQHQGLDNTARVAILEAGLSYQAIQMSHSDAEFMATRKFQISEVARWFNIPPHMLKDLEKSSFSNITHQSEEFVLYSLLPWIIRFEQEINRKIFMHKWTVNKRRYCKFNFEKTMLRPQMLERYKAHQIAILTGFSNRDEARKAEGQNAIPDGKGKEYLTPLNMGPIQQEEGKNDPTKTT